MCDLLVFAESMRDTRLIRRKRLEDELGGR